MNNAVFLHNDSDDYHDKRLTLHDCIAEKITFDNNILSLYFPNGFWICPSHESAICDKPVRTDSAQVDFRFGPDECSEIYLEVFKKRKFRKTIVESWNIEKLIKSVNSGKYQLEFVYQYRSLSEQMWMCYLRLKGSLYGECHLHIPCDTATYRWNNLIKDSVW